MPETERERERERETGRDKWTEQLGNQNNGVESGMTYNSNGMG